MSTIMTYQKIAEAVYRHADDPFVSPVDLVNILTELFGEEESKIGGQHSRPKGQRPTPPAPPPPPLKK